jgi:U4/U6 small nuclear ribonucleoprotein PRP31
VADELIRLHKVLRDNYSTRFPKLEILVTTPIKYAKTSRSSSTGLSKTFNDIKTLAAGSEKLVGAPLQTILDGPSLMAVSVEGTTTKGREMTDAELSKVTRICEWILKFDLYKAYCIDRIRLESRVKIDRVQVDTIIDRLISTSTWVSQQSRAKVKAKQD